MTDQDLLRRRIAVAEQICAHASGLAVQANVRLRERPIDLTRRDRVLVGLALKIDSSFRALIDDCKAERPEAMHHLKTMAECMIYFYAVPAPGRLAERLLRVARPAGIGAGARGPAVAGPRPGGPRTQPKADPDS